MVKHLYETLGVSHDASFDEIRRAYKKRALATHPDKVKQGATDKEKANAEEEFRKVNNAYEVLSDDAKRKQYDLFGEWPPPEVEAEPHANYYNQSQHSHHHQPSFDDFFNHPFFPNSFGASSSRTRSRPNQFGFTDPFALFNAVFEDMHRQFDDPFFGSTSSFGFHSSSPFNGMGSHPFGGFAPFSHPLLGSSSMFPDGSSFQSSQTIFTSGNGSGNQYVSQSRTTRSINGVTESVWKRVDQSGNEHITYSYPDGRERYLLNGVEQPSSGTKHGERNLPSSSNNAQRAIEYDRNRNNSNPYPMTRHEVSTNGLPDRMRNEAQNVMPNDNYGRDYDRERRHSAYDPDRQRRQAQAARDYSREHHHTPSHIYKGDKRTHSQSPEYDHQHKKHHWWQHGHEHEHHHRDQFEQPDKRHHWWPGRWN